MLIDTGKDGYDCAREFVRRTRAAVDGEASEWGDPEKLFERDALDVLEFVKGDYQLVAPILAGLKSDWILDLGCGYGRLAPLLTAFRCSRYLGLDSQNRRVGLAQLNHARQSKTRGVSFLVDNVLRPSREYGKWDVVWTSNVLQHLTVPDKRRLVETMKACRAPGGICLLREEEIHRMSRECCEKRYAGAEQPRHMIPVPAEELREAFLPLDLEYLGGNVWRAREGQFHHGDTEDTEKGGT